MVLYLGSMSDEVFAEIQPYKSKVEVVPWPLLSKRSKLTPDVLPLKTKSLQASQTAAFADCWMRYAPTSQRITMTSIDAIRFPPVKDDNTNSDSIFNLLHPSWTIAQLLSHKIVQNRYDELVISERCYARAEVFGWRSDCERMVPGEKTNSSVETISIRKSRGNAAVVSSYQGDIQRCVARKSTMGERPAVLKLEFDLEKNRPELNPCLLRLRRDNMKCRVAVDYSSMMFRERMKISLVKKRSVLLFSHGCHL